MTRINTTNANAVENRDKLEEAGRKAATSTMVSVQLSKRASATRAGLASVLSGTFRRKSGFALLCAVVAASIALPGSVRAANNKSERAAATTPAPAMAMMSAEAGQLLSDMGYWSGKVDGESKIDSKATSKITERMQLALLAFQRVQGRKLTGKLDEVELEALRVACAPTPRETGYAHIEVDLTRQVLFLVDAKNTVSLVLPISSGSGKLYTFEGKTERAVTPAGRFTVYNKVRGWRKAPLGMILYPCYFNKGIAIHGSQSVPNYPASHGCIRIPIITAKELSDILPVGTTVLVYV